MIMMANTLRGLVPAAALATALVSTPVAAETRVLGTIAPGEFEYAAFLPGPVGTFSDVLTFTLGSGVSTARASAVSLNLAPFLGVSDFTGTLYSGTDVNNPGNLVVGAPTLTDDSSPFDYAIGAGTYSFLFEGTTTGTGGGAYATAVAAVPEPGQLALLLAGLGVLAWVAGRRSGKDVSQY